jgi:hypothetical protein
MSDKPKWKCPFCGRVWRIAAASADVTCGKCGNRFAQDGTPIGPSLARKAANLARDTAAHVANSRKLVSDEVRAFRLAQCHACPLFNGTICTHKKCGCGMKNERGFLDALSWESKKCPVGRWDAPATEQPIRPAESRP